MPVRMLNFLREPPPPKQTQGKISVLTETEEYKDMMIALAAGLKAHEYIAVGFTPGHQVFSKVKYPHLALLHAAKKKIAALHLSYDAYIRNDEVYIVGRP